MQLIQLFIFILYNVFSTNIAYAKSELVPPYSIYISPLGNDFSDGQSPTLDSDGIHGPFATFKRARYEIRQLRKYSKLPHGTNIYVRGGTYELNETILLEAQDSGTQQSPVTFQTYNNEKVILSGGRKLSSCSSNKPKLITCNTSPINLNDLDAIGLEKRLLDAPLPPFEVFLKDQRLQLTRWPNSNRNAPGGDTWAYISSAPKGSHTKFEYHGSNPSFSKLSKNAVIHIWPANDWFDEYIGISNPAPATFTLTNPTTYAIQTGRRFSILNEPETMDVPGEWSYSADQQKLLIIPIPNLENNLPIVSYLDNVIELRNTEYINFKGFIIEHSRKTAVKISMGGHNTIRNCTIRNSGGYGVVIKAGQNHTVTQSEIHDTGYGGIILNGGNRKKLIPSSHAAINNNIHHTGRLIRTGKAALRINGVGNIGRHNQIHHTPGTAVSINGNDHLLELNNIHHACEESSDCGAVYAGRDWTFHGNKIQYNNIHDIYGYGMKRIDTEKSIVEYTTPHGARGVYLDDAASGFEVIGNIFYRIPDKMIQIGGGRDNTVDNNIFITNGYAIWIDARWPNFPWEKTMMPRLNAMPYKSSIWQNRFPELTKPMKNPHWPEGNQITHNIIVGEKPAKNTIIPFRYTISPKAVVIDNNIVWNHGKNIKVEYRFLENKRNPPPVSWTIWKTTSLDENSLLIDPKFISSVQGNFSLRSDSPAQKLGIQELPLKDIADSDNSLQKGIIPSPTHKIFQYDL